MFGSVSLFLFLNLIRNRENNRLKDLEKQEYVGGRKFAFLKSARVQNEEEELETFSNQIRIMMDKQTDYNNKLNLFISQKHGKMPYQRSAGSYYGNMFLPNTKVEIETYITANLIVDSDAQKAVAIRNTRFHDVMTPFLMMTPSPDFVGHVVEYGSLVMLWGCDPNGPKIPCGYQKDATRQKCNRWKCCWNEQGCFRIGCENLLTLTMFLK